MPLPMVEPTRTAMALQSPRCRGRRSPQASGGCGVAWLNVTLTRACRAPFFPALNPRGHAFPLNTSTDRDRTGLLRRLAWAGSGFALGLIVLGGIVRITGSGMGCGDHWPRCDGEWFPPLDLPDPDRDRPPLGRRAGEPARVRGRRGGLAAAPERARAPEPGDCSRPSSWWSRCCSARSRSSWSSRPRSSSPTSPTRCCCWRRCSSWRSARQARRSRAARPAASGTGVTAWCWPRRRSASW